MSNNKFKAELKNELKSLPILPGVYLMKDEAGHIIYIGKAINLKRRVSGYFHSRHKIYKTEKLVARINSFEIIITDTELEALVLECKLIKEHRPQYNTLMKNDWRYPYIKITDELFPRVVTTASPEDDGAVYFGPYKGYEDIERVLRLVKRLWGVRNCDTPITLKQEKSPCFYFHIEKCKGPCGGNVSLDEYLNDIQNIKKFLSGNYTDIINKLKKEMNSASKNMLYEKAAIYRDNLFSVQSFVKKQKIMLDSLEEKDLLIFTDSHIENTILVFFIRFGRIFDKTQINHDISQSEVKERITEFLSKHYTNIIPKPSGIKKSEIDEIIVIQGWLHHTKSKKACVTIKRKNQEHILEAAALKSVTVLIENHFLADS